MSTRAAGTRDFYIASHSNVYGWGGGLAFTLGLADAFRQRDYTSLVLGIDDDAPPSRRPFAGQRLNLPTGVPKALWRVRSWCLPAMLAGSLRRLPPPRVAFVAVSPTWVVAAKRAWPDVPVVFAFACLLSNCLPFTWPRRRPAGLWARADCRGIRRTEWLAFAQADLVLAPTGQSVDEIAAFVRRPVAHLERCDYGVRPLSGATALRTLQRQALGARPDDFLVAAIGVCDRNKAFDVALRAWPQVDRRAHLLIVGDGPERANLERLTAALGLTARVTFAGAQRDMAAWYAAADCVLSTSSYDTFPNVLLEALDLGRPVVVPEHDPPRAYSGFAEVVREQRCGLIYDRAAPVALAACLNRLARDPREAAELGARGLQTARRRYRWTKAAAHILNHCGITPLAPKPDRQPAALQTATEVPA